MSGLAVRDDGKVVHPEDRERAFERFTRFDEARSTSDCGAELGVAIVRDIIERHGGTLTGEDGRPGVRFVMRLPLPPVTLPCSGLCSGLCSASCPPCPA